MVNERGLMVYEWIDGIWVDIKRTIESSWLSCFRSSNVIIYDKPNKSKSRKMWIKSILIITNTTKNMVQQSTLN
jgi:hypothetical protein